MDMEKLLAMMMGMNAGDAGTYEEIRKLDHLLMEAGIPHEFRPHMLGGYQITYYGPKGKPQPEPGITFQGAGVGAVCSAIETPISYGHENDRIEISGLMTAEEYEKVHDSVLGDLTAEDVFARIQAHWTEANRQ